ncbi:Quinolinate synthase A [Paraliobacillus sp. PM-2]|uniref:quinolinate synthase NadA n=1 Tax=Paraliobacillus sp. PM-2 TaxID=1462524 RepID=UPI00061C9870|nr:quinolinate synthase NadA [Paraliobacillus sp. PM-2]CQR46967.1 Quinolinate synthase A [Paraliobacillus sp. PM-2]
MQTLDFLKQINQQLPAHYRELSDKEMIDKIAEIKADLGHKLYIPGHHYQKDEVIQFADDTGDSLQLARLAKQNKEATYIVFCGVHFMAETADMLTKDDQIVILPDMKAGCSMADMANMEQTTHCWNELQQLFGDTIIPLTYVNSTAEIKAFVGKNYGATVTSSNVKEMVKWAFTQKKRILFLPDQHLGRNTAFDLNIPLDEMAVWDPITNQLNRKGELEDIRVILWKGHCSVHENFTTNNISYLREKESDRKIIVHPECKWEVVQQADYAGSTKYIIDTISTAPPGSKWAIGTEMNLVKRLIKQHPDKDIISLNPHMCPCLTMNRIDLAHLLWTLESLKQGKVINRIQVNPTISKFANEALEKMLATV